ncbi:hypothetical protein [Tsukamurella paurometabola]|uniref:Uncharacterized protein n=1 Tax=Tsukamurella paurometabola TaxID=2061 RepID=A0A3P8MCA0_TSUPA|nr:hypothetical protein [Tsukamurella paurometabola]UEA83215.1 hypothetical protein LK411_23170 [Tsukamurella paurometabola]VDR40310.1 Uncharacterised protein [Tsukamurella paurometabola]
MTTMKKMIGSTLLGATVLGGLATIGAGTAAAAPNPAQPGTPSAGQGSRPPAVKPAPAARPAANRVPQAAPRSNGQNPNWRPGPVYRQGAWHTPVWDQGRNHWGFWLGPIWIPVG